MANDQSARGASRPLRLSEALRQEYQHVFEARTNSKPDPLGKPSMTQAEEDQHLKAVFRTFHDKKPTALCISGGGIRSATFSLGVIQGLARNGRLGAFDYLSTVSGGGYIGSWLSAWINRAGFTQVEETLRAKTSSSGTDAESQQVDHLRSYSNYLTPRMGLLSADTWACGSTVVRNLVLNWLVLLPVFVVLMLLPQLSVTWLDAYAPPDDSWGRASAVALAFVAVMIAIAYIEIDLPGGGDWRKKQGAFLTWSLLPLVVAAALLSAVWASLISHAGHLQVASHALTAKEIGDAPWYWFAIVGAAVHTGGWLLGYGIVWIGASSSAKSGDGAAVSSTRKAKAPYEAVMQLLAIPGSGALGGLGLRFVLRQLPVEKAYLGVVASVAPPALLLVFFLATVACVGALSRITSDEDREWWARSGGWVLIAALGWLGVFGTSLLGHAMINRVITTAGGLGGIATFIGGRSTKIPAGRRPDAEPSKTGVALDWATTLGAPLFIFALFVALAWLVQWAPGWWYEGVQNRPTEWDRLAVQGIVLGICIVLCALAGWFVDINRFSLHAMYRNRLIRAYLGASRARRPSPSSPDCRDPNPFTGFDPNDNLPMRDLRTPSAPRPNAVAVATPPPQRPFHVVNVALNLVKGTRLAWQTRKAESFTFTPLHAGSAVIEEQVATAAAETIRGAYQDIGSYGDGMTLGTALAISGAAVSPNMGYHSSPLVAILLALLNARLGWWVANPATPGKRRWQKRGPGFSLRPYLSETFGLTDDRSKYVYLSDGGHFENLGLYEMVLRRCHTIVVIDAGCDEKYQFDDLGNAIRKIRIDLGISIKFDTPLPMRAEVGSHNAYYAVGTIDYDEIDEKAPTGTLYYIKPILNGSEPVDVRNYHAAHPQFPHESTGDQWFDEDQFESYRMLGLHALEQWCTSTASWPASSSTL